MENKIVSVVKNEYADVESMKDGILPDYASTQSLKDPEEEANDEDVFVVWSSSEEEGEESENLNVKLSDQPSLQIKTPSIKKKKNPYIQTTFTTVEQPREKLPRSLRYHNRVPHSIGTVRDTPSDLELPMLDTHPERPEFQTMPSAQYGFQRKMSFNERDFDIAYVIALPLFEDVKNKKIKKGEPAEKEVVELELEDEIRRFTQNALAGTRKKIRFIRQIGTVEKLRQLLTYGTSVLHLSCHGLPGEIQLEHHGKGDAFNSRKFREVFQNCVRHTHSKKGDAWTPELVFLAACKSEKLGRALSDECNIEHVICIRGHEKLYDDAAKIFSEVFYFSLMNDIPVYQAFISAQSHVRDRVGSYASDKFLLLPDDWDPEEGNPHDRLLFEDRPAIGHKREKPYEDLTNYPHRNCDNLAESVVGRKLEVRRVVEYFLFNKTDTKVVLVEGPAGSGKTTFLRKVIDYSALREHFTEIFYVSFPEVGRDSEGPGESKSSSSMSDHFLRVFKQFFVTQQNRDEKKFPSIQHLLRQYLSTYLEDDGPLVQYMDEMKAKGTLDRGKILLVLDGTENMLQKHVPNMKENWNFLNALCATGKRVKLLLSARTKDFGHRSDVRTQFDKFGSTICKPLPLCKLERENMLQLFDNWTDRKFHAHLDSKIADLLLDTFQGTPRTMKNAMSEIIDCKELEDVKNYCLKNRTNIRDTRTRRWDEKLADIGDIFGDYAASFRRMGYEQPEYWHEITTEELKNNIHMKPGHIKIWMKYFENWKKKEMREALGQMNPVLAEYAAEFQKEGYEPGSEISVETARKILKKEQFELWSKQLAVAGEPEQFSVSLGSAAELTPTPSDEQVQMAIATLQSLGLAWQSKDQVIEKLRLSGNDLENMVGLWLQTPAKSGTFSFDGVAPTDSSSSLHLAEHSLLEVGGRARGSGELAGFKPDDPLCRLQAQFKDRPLDRVAYVSYREALHGRLEQAEGPDVHREYLRVLKERRKLFPDERQPSELIIQRCEECLERDAQDAEILLELGKAYSALIRFDFPTTDTKKMKEINEKAKQLASRAEETFEAVLKIDGKHLEGHISYAEFLLKMVKGFKQFDGPGRTKCRKCIDRAQELCGDDDRHQIRCALVSAELLILKEDDESLQQAEKLLHSKLRNRDGEQNWDVYLKLGKCHEWMNKQYHLTCALRFYDEIIKDASDKYKLKALEKKRRIYQWKRSNAELLETVDHALRIHERMGTVNPELYYYRGGSRKRMVRDLRKQNPTSQKILELIQEAENDFKMAKDYKEGLGNQYGLIVIKEMHGELELKRHLQDLEKLRIDWLRLQYEY